MSLDNCEQCGKTCYVRVIGMSGGLAICSTCEATQVTDIDAVCEAVVKEKNALIEELERDLERWIETAANFLAAGATVEAELEIARPVVAAAMAWRASHHTGHQRSAGELIAAIDAARGVK